MRSRRGRGKLGYDQISLENLHGRGQNWIWRIVEIWIWRQRGVGREVLFWIQCPSYISGPIWPFQSSLQATSCRQVTPGSIVALCALSSVRPFAVPGYRKPAQPFWYPCKPGSVWKLAPNRQHWTNGSRSWQTNTCLFHPVVCQIWVHYTRVLRWVLSKTELWLPAGRIR